MKATFPWIVLLAAMVLGMNLCLADALTQVSLFDDHVCAVLPEGVKCWGNEFWGNLGYGDGENKGDDIDEMGGNLPYVDLGANLSVKQVAAGTTHTCALFDDGRVKCWGQGLWGQLGLGDILARGAGLPDDMGDNLPFVDLGTEEKASYLATGFDHTCALLVSGNVKCWGKCDSGNCGSGNSTYIGSGPYDMGDNLSYVDLGSDRTALQISCGVFHTCALLDNYKVKCWGDSLPSGRLLGSDPNQIGDSLAYVDLGENRTATFIDTNRYHSCAILDNGELRCWGENFGDYLLGIGRPGDIPSATFGMNESLADLGVNLSVVKVAVGLRHTCVLFSNNRIKCWGEGGATIGSNQTLGDDAGEMGANLTFIEFPTEYESLQIIDMQAGDRFSCLVFVTNDVACFGSSAFGGIGLNSAVLGRIPSTLQTVDLLAENETLSPTLFPSLPPTSSPTKAPQITISPTNAPQTSSPTPSPLPFDEEYPELFGAIVIVSTLVAVACCLFPIKREFRYVAFIMAIGAVDFFGDIVYLTTQTFISTELRILGICVLFLPTLVFLYLLKRQSFIHGHSLDNLNSLSPLRYALPLLHEGTVALAYLQWHKQVVTEEHHETCSKILSSAWAVLQKGLRLLGIGLCIILLMVLALVSNVCLCFVWLLSFVCLCAAMPFVINLRLIGVPTVCTFLLSDTNEGDATILFNIAVLTEVWFESIPQLTITLVNTLSQGELNIIFYISASGSAISIICAAWPVIYWMLVGGLKFDNAIRMDAFRHQDALDHRHRVNWLKKMVPPLATG